MNALKEVYYAYMFVFHDKRYYAYWVLISVVFILLYYSIPVIIVPGNDIVFQISIMKWYDHGALLSFSILLSLLVVMHLYSYHIKKRFSLNKKRDVLSYVGGFLSGLISSLGCASCFITTISFIPSTSVLFLYEYRVFLYMLSYVLILVSLYYTSLKVNGKCKRCS